MSVGVSHGSPPEEYAAIREDFAVVDPLMERKTARLLNGPIYSKGVSAVAKRLGLIAVGRNNVLATRFNSRS